MSSLINSASVYIAGDTPKKRVSTMRKTIKKKYLLLINNTVK